MRFVSFSSSGRIGVGIWTPSNILRGVVEDDAAFPGSLDEIVKLGMVRSAFEVLEKAPEIDPATIRFCPPLSKPSKILCVGINYRDHASETGFELPKYPEIFARFPSSVVGHNEQMQMSSSSRQLDFEGELAFVIGVAGKRIGRESALSHVAGYSIFNDASVRDYQTRVSQWTIGKNFDAIGAFGPFLVTPDEVPLGASGLRLETRLNGAIMQDATTSDLILGVQDLIVQLSETMTLMPGDVVVTGTPSGVGIARKPPVWMKPGDIVEVAIEGLGVLRNAIVDHTSTEIVDLEVG